MTLNTGCRHSNKVCPSQVKESRISLVSIGIPPFALVPQGMLCVGWFTWLHPNSRAYSYQWRLYRQRNLRVQQPMVLLSPMLCAGGFSWIGAYISEAGLNVLSPPAKEPGELRRHFGESATIESPVSKQANKQTNKNLRLSWTKQNTSFAIHKDDTVHFLGVDHCSREGKRSGADGTASQLSTGLGQHIPNDGRIRNNSTHCFIHNGSSYRGRASWTTFTMMHFLWMLLHYQ